MSTFYPSALRGGDKKQEAEKELSKMPVLVIFVMDGCPHCEATEPAWKELKKKMKGGVNVVEVESSATPESTGVTGFPTLQYRDSSGTKEISGAQQSASQIASGLGLKMKGGRKRSMTKRRSLRRRRYTRRR